MNRNIVVKTIAAALSAFTAISVPSAALAAYVPNRAATLGTSAGIDLVTADADFGDGMDGWEVSGGKADASDGEIRITASGEASLTTGIGGSLYKSASGSDVLSWDFESDEDIADGVNLIGESDVGRWTSARASNPYYTETQAAVEPYNIQYKEEGGKESVVINWQDGVTELLPPDGSERCLTVFNPKNKEWTDYMGIRVKLSDSMLKVGETYTLSFRMMENSHRRSIYCGRTPYAENELSVNTDSLMKNGVLNYNDWTHNLVAEKTVKQWTKYSAVFTPSAEEFNDEGYTTLWIITTGKHTPGSKEKLDNRNNIYKYEKFYFDNISIERETPKAKITEYHFGAKVKGESGKKITAKLEIDGTDKIFEATKTFAKTDEWESLTADFSVSGDIPYLSGDSKGSCFAADDPRVKLSVSADGGFAADDIHIIENIVGDIGKYAGRSILLIAEVVGFEDTEDATAVCRIGDKKVFEEPTSLLKGVNALSFEGVIPMNADGPMTFDMTYGGESIFDRENIVTMFSRNGANVYPSIEALRSFGAGRYLAEFDVAGGAAGDKATISIGGASEEAEVFAGGIGIAEIYLSEEDIEKLADTDEITVICGKSVGNITLKKVGNDRK